MHSSDWSWIFKIIVTKNTPCGNLISFPISNPNQFIQQLAMLLVKILLVLANDKNIFISDGNTPNYSWSLVVETWTNKKNTRPEPITLA